MKIESKFDVNNIVAHKFQKDGHDAFIASEILGVQTDTCYAGTQVFYLCRNLMLQKKRDFEYKGDEVEKKHKWEVNHAISGDTKGQIPLQGYREDEIVECPKKFIDIILNK